jgi:hypothetical protein
MTINARWRKSFERSDKIRLVAHLVTSAKLGVAGAFPTKNIERIWSGARRSRPNDSSRISRQRLAESPKRERLARVIRLEVRL